MEKNRTPQARRIWQWLAAAVGLLLFAGCESVTITNLTPSTLPVNPSQIYTFSARLTPNTRGYVPGSMQPSIVVDGKIHAMEPSAVGPDVYEFDYQIPAGRSEISYYYLVGFDVEFNGSVSPREAYSGINRVELQGRFVLSMVANRGPVGALVGIVGQGFTADDAVSFNGQPARTVFYSANSIGFYVPATAPGRNYEVALVSPRGNKLVGTFRVDAVVVSVTPSSLNLASGQTQNLTFTLPQTAPPGGLLLDITTNVPDSVIMPEVVVPAGASTVTIPVRGGSPGSGSLFLGGFGSGEVVVPVTVR